MIRSLYFTPDAPIKTDLAVSDYPASMQNPDGVLWVDFEATPPETDAPILLDTFGFHPLAVDDALQESHVPKLDDWDRYIYIVMHAVTYNKQLDDDVNTLELDVFLGKNFMVTHHDQKIPALDHVWATCQRDDRHWKNGVDHLLYRLSDEVAVSYMQVVEDLDVQIDIAEDKIFDNPTPRTLEQIFLLKRAVLHLRRIVGPQREVLNKLARDDFEAIDAKARIYFRDVYDHYVRLYDISESIRDMVSGALDTYLSVINNRMNDIMKTLTLITTMFMPISFVASFFGMNFFAPVAPLGHWTDMPAFWLTMLLVIITPYTMYLWARRRGWM